MSVFIDLQKANLMDARCLQHRGDGLALLRPKSAFGAVGKMSGTCLDPNFRAETSWKEEDGACKPCKHQRLEIESAKNDTQKESISSL